MTTVLWLVVILLVAVHLVSITMFLRRLSGPEPQGVIGKPPVTLLRPVCGLDDFDEETLRSSFHQDWPEVHVIFCAATEGDRAVPLVRRLISDHPHVKACLLIGDERISGNPKLNNLVKGWAAAQTEYICMTDSNLLLPVDYLTRLAAAWGPDTGLVSSPAIGTRPGNLAGALECALLNSNQARLQFAADSLGMGFAQGKTLFWRRNLLERAGGLHVLGLRLAEDVAATRAIRGLGLRVSLPRLPFAQPIGNRSLRGVWDRQLRWSKVRREGVPLVFLAEWLNGPAVPFLLAALGGGWPALILLALLWYGSEVLLMRRAGWPAGWRDIAALPLRDLMLPAIFVATFARRGFEWRGTAMGTQTGTRTGTRTGTVADPLAGPKA